MPDLHEIDHRLARIEVHLTAIYERLLKMPTQDDLTAAINDVLAAVQEESTTMNAANAANDQALAVIDAEIAALALQVSPVGQSSIDSLKQAAAAIRANNVSSQTSVAKLLAGVQAAQQAQPSGSGSSSPPTSTPAPSTPPATPSTPPAS